MKANQTIRNTSNVGKRGRVLTIFICIFLAILLAVGGTLGIISAVKSSRAAVKYEGVMADEGTVRYLASYYKYLYKTALAADGIVVRDTEKFWASEAEPGKTHGELLSEGFKNYLSGIMVANRLFLDYSSYTSLDKETVEATAKEVLLYSEAKGSVDVFNSLSESYGFDYDDFLSAAELLYKAQMAESLIYGASGGNLQSFPDECEQYLAEYSHVALLFFRTEETFLLDENGDRTYDGSGNVKMRELTDAEKAVVQEKIAFLDDAIEKHKNDEDGQITPTTFELYLDKSDSDPEMKTTGYYFHADAERTAEFAQAFPEVVEAALEMELYSYEKVDCSIGVCYLYRYDAVEGAYSDEENVFFSDFYSDAADYFFSEALAAFSPDVSFTGKYDNIDIFDIPINSQFYIKGWK